MKNAIKITLLCEDQARMGFRDKPFAGQHGLSLFIEAGVDLLLDAGPSEVVLKNAAVAGVDLSSTQWIVLSHGHWDHADGLFSLAAAGIRAKLLAHPNVFADRRKASGEFNGMGMSRAEAASFFELVETARPFQIAEDVWFLGEIPRMNDFEGKRTNFVCFQNGRETADLLPDDTALAVRHEKGLAVMAGCSHAGICNICEHAKKVTGEERLHLVMGGFHLLEDSEALEKTIDYFRKEKVQRLYPMHCTALPALAAFYAAFKIEKLCAGDGICVA